MSADDDQRMKELIDRLVAMSPEPPPYPEEVTVTTPQSSSKRNPMLMFAGAAALVLLIAIPILLSGNNNNTADSTIPGAVDSTTTTATTPESTSSVPAPTTTTSTPPVMSTYQAVIYLIQDPANSYLHNPALVAFATDVEAEEVGFDLNGSDDTSLVELRLDILTNPELIMPSERFTSAIPDGVEVVGVTAGDTEGIIVVDMNEAFLDGAGGLLADMTMLNQLIYTAAPPWLGTEAVQFTVGGEPVEAFGSEGLDLTEPVTRTDFENELNPIIVTEPVIYNGDEVPRVAGRANVFEAALSLQIVESESGEVVYEDNTTATAGTGTWGDYTFSLDTPALTPDRLILVFWYSAKDGSPSDVVTIPVNPEGSWVLLPDQS